MRVDSVRYQQLAKIYRLANRRRLRTHRYCCLGPGDDLVFRGPGQAYAKCRNGLAVILPPYKATDFLVMGTRHVALIVK